MNRQQRSSPFEQLNPLGLDDIREHGELRIQTG
jgi:hypothetical protein